MTDIDALPDELVEFLKEARRMMGFQYGEKPGTFWSEVTDDGNLKLIGYGDAMSSRDEMVQLAQEPPIHIIDYTIELQPCDEREEHAPDWVPALIVGVEQ